MSGTPDAWQAWQREHSEALAELQEKQRAYHRVVAAQALGGSSGDPAAPSRHRTLLDEIEAARIRLDGIRARRPITE